MKTNTLAPQIFQILGLIYLVGFSACNCSSDTFLNNTWVLESYGPEGAPTEVMSPASVTPPGTGIITLFFNEGQVQGNDGCNSYFGSYTLNNCDFSTGNLNSTLVLCSPEIMDQANTYSTILREVKTFRTKNNQLTLRTDDNRKLIFRKQ